MRPWQKSVVGSSTAWHVWGCGCGTVKCGGMLVLETHRVRKLDERAQALGSPIRWTPVGDEIVRSNRLRPYFNTYLWYSPGAETTASLAGLVMTPPPPLEKGRRIRVRT